MTRALVWKIDTFEKAVVVIDVMRMRFTRADGIAAAIKYLFSEYPETRNCSHEYLASELICCTRESVTRTGLVSRGIKKRKCARP